MELLVVITTVQLQLLAWVGAISFFMSVAVTAMVSPNRQWFELAVIFAICFAINLGLVGLVVQGIAGMDLIKFEAIQSLQASSRG